MAHEFVYAPTMRALRRNAQPPGYIRMDASDGRGPFGVITYPRALSKNEIEEWALRTVEMPRTNYFIYGVFANGSHELLLEWQKEMPGGYEAAVKRAEELERVEDFVDYVATPA